jgi:hypothetical protein
MFQFVIWKNSGRKQSELSDSRGLSLQNGRQDVPVHHAENLSVHVPFSVRGAGNDDDQRLIFEDEDLAAAIAGGEKRLMTFAPDREGCVPEQVSVKVTAPRRERYLFRKSFLHPITSEQLSSIPSTTVLVKLAILCKIERAHL